MSRTVGVLIVDGRPNDGQVIPLLGGKNTMGRQMGNDVFDDSVGVSRVHAEIVETQAGYNLRDLSRNGTFVNGERVAGEQYLLKDGDRLRLGPSDVSFLFRSDTATTQAISLD